MKKEPLFFGPGQGPEDEQRLLTQLEFIRRLMLDGRWRTLVDIQDAFIDAGRMALVTSISAALRALRRPIHGGYLVDREMRGSGLFVYRVRRRRIGQ